jgi:hypothetical protein
MDFKVYWYPSEAIIAAVIATLGIGGLYYVHPSLHPLAYGLAWFVLAGFLYQTGCELTARRQLNTKR